MSVIPKCMSTQHPDNASVPSYASDGVLRGDGEVREAVELFAMGCDEQMWDSEGKEADNQVVQKLLTNHADFFTERKRLGTDCRLTLRVPNPRIEVEMRKSLVEALQGIPKAWDVAAEFYSGDIEPPISEVILPFTTTADELSDVDAYYRRFVVGQETLPLRDGRSVSDWIGEFHPKRVRVIPLVEDMEHLTNCDVIVRRFLRDSEQTDHQRVFLARSDPAMNYGAVAAELMLKMALARLGRLEEETGVPLYPIIGVGAVPFRGHLSPVNVGRAFAEYPSAQTFTVQSAFKFDYPPDTVRAAIEQIMAHERSAPMPIDEERAQAIIDKAAAEHQSQVRSLAPVIAAIAPKVPKRRERKLHVGLFGYGRRLGDNGDSAMTLPRAISFTASLYSIGVPPELLGLGALNADDMAYVREVYPSFDHDMATALRYANEARVREVLGDDYARLARQLGGDVDGVHEGLTSAIWATIGRASSVNVPHYIAEAAQLRRFLG